MLLTSIIKTSSRPRRWPLAALVLAGLLVSGAGPAAANPKPLPFTYLHAVQPEGAFELEAYTDMTPVRVARETDDGTEAVTGVRAELQVELEVGLAEGLEFGWYFVFRQGASGRGAALEFKGLKQRLRWQLAPEGAWPIDVALYGEIGELDDEIELEQKVILSKRIGALRLGVNLWFEQEYYFQDDLWKLVYHPTVGAAWELSPRVALGLEYWVRGRFDDNTQPTTSTTTSVDTTDPVHYLGPTLLLVSPGPWFSLGAYVRLDDLPDAAVVGDPYGKLWFRAIVGFDL